MGGARNARRSVGIGFSLALSVAVFLGGGGAASADEYAIQNDAAFSGGPIVTVDITTHTFVNSFIPDQATHCPSAVCNGRGVEVLGNFLYYTELASLFSVSSGIFVAQYNSGAGGHDIKSFANPVPGTGIVDLAASGGLLYAMAGYPNGPEVVQATDGNGNNVGVTITLYDLSGKTLKKSDGFSVLPNGNWLINTDDGANDYNQFNPLTGNEIARTTISAPGCSASSGVDNDGTSLFFDCLLNHSIVQTDLTGSFISSTSTGTFSGEDISLVQAPPRQPPSVPEPTSLCLLGSALLGFGRLRRRKRPVSSLPLSIAQSPLRPPGARRGGARRGA